MDGAEVERLLALDAQRVWHPYAPMPATVPARFVTGAEGVRITIEDNKGTSTQLIDGMASWWSAVHGYRHPVLDAAAHEQLGRMSHVMLGGLTHEPVVELATTLTDLAPGDLAHVFFSDSGSVSVEVALKMCIQFWLSQGRPRKKKVLTWRGGYHGDTWAPMSVCDPDSGMHRLWTGVLPEQVFADAPPGGFDAPPDERYEQHLADLVEQHEEELAAIIVEPVMQGAGGMRFHNPAYLRHLRTLADEHDVLLVFDEIATGFGRTGALFAANHADVVPDVLCLGKSLTGGYLSLGATLCTTRVAQGIAQGEVPVLAHGPTFMGNPLTCAIARASVDLVVNGRPWRTNVERIQAALEQGLDGASEIDGVQDVRVQGAVGVVQLDHEVDLAAATDVAVENGVWLRPFRDLVYTTPPYICTDDDIAAISSAIKAVATRC